MKKATRALVQANPKPQAEERLPRRNLLWSALLLRLQHTATRRMRLLLHHPGEAATRAAGNNPTWQSRARERRPVGLMVSAAVLHTHPRWGCSNAGVGCCFWVQRSLQFGTVESGRKSAAKGSHMPQLG